jgi:hypothetical protein
MTGIYKIVNSIDNKIYIGSAKCIHNRFTTHKNLLKRGKHFNTHLQSAVNKYGLDNFNFEIVEIIKIDKNIIDYKKVIQEREEYYILAYNSNNNNFGYNRRTKCETNLGIKFSEETKQKLSESHMGHKRSKEANEKIIASQYKEVYKIDEFGRIVEKYQSLKDAAEKNNLHRSSISACCRNVLNSTGGFYWCFVELYKENFHLNKNKINEVEKRKEYIYINTETSELFYTLTGAAKSINMKITTLLMMFDGTNKNKTKFVRVEKNDYLSRSNL